MDTLLSYTFTILVGIFTYKVICLARNIQLARKTALPYIITPLLETEALALLVNPLLRCLYRGYLDRGKGWPRWCRFFIKDWAWEDKRQAHDVLGDVFLCVSPAGIICYSADATMGWDVMNRRNTFTKPRDKYRILEPYGKNVATAEGKEYQFHVRITAPPFGDLSGVNSLVWSETSRQTRRLMEAWAKSPPKEIQEDVNTLTLAVISLAGFGRQLVWNHDDQGDGVPASHQLSFLGALQDTLRFMVPILLFPRWMLRIILHKAALAHAELDRYLRDIIRDQTAKLSENINHTEQDSRGNLLTAVVRASIMIGSEQGSATSPPLPGERKQGFTEDETMGNLFIYLLAGYETTANAIIYGLAALALYPDVQARVIEEIDTVHARAQSVNRSQLTYEDDFEFLQYTYGFMYETFRLFPGVTLITKMIHRPEHIITVEPNGTHKSYSLPAGTRVYLNAPAVHYHPKHWPDPYRLDPNRWLISPNGEKHVVASDRTRHMRGTLLTFSDGSRACLGRKFAHAEYISFFVTLLGQYRVVLPHGSDPEVVARDLFGKSAGTITLAPHGNVPISIQSRKHSTHC
ncbi:putative cytochrome P450 oxidoreductase [Aspergillus violaceofuscus CBS 115571]|uniref:Putative cytochrome P450 oxidoreductase n=1 Tax=Aspergillus violaceofuscus (strain CBS 115571) TaxID=1450538 RepID=A0A2V5IKY4_ASPV1|nr:putative cytochrome P450 oxidoreductase [Aspergillus violaceofuscus CBS 115571]